MNCFYYVALEGNAGADLEGVEKAIIMVNFIYEKSDAKYYKKNVTIGEHINKLACKT